MISSEKLSKRIDSFFNRSGSASLYKIPTADKVRALNAAQILLVKKKMNYNNIYKMGFESLLKRFDDLQFLLKQKEVKVKTKDDEIFYASLPNEEDYMFYITSSCKGSNDCCENGTMSNNLVKTKDLNIYLKDENHKPSFEWGENLVRLEDNKIFIYTDGTYKIDTVNLHYLKKPRNIDIKGYTTDGKASLTINSEFPEFLEDELLDVALVQLAMQSDNPALIQYAQSKQQTNE